MAVGFPVTSFPNQAAYLSSSGRPLTMGEIKAKLGTRVLNTSRIEVDSRYLAGLQDNQPALKPERLLPETGWKSVDEILGKTGQAGAYAWYGGLDVIAESTRGALVGSLGGGALGLLGGALAHLARKSWLLKYCLPVGAFLGGGLGLLSGSTMAFAKTTIRLSKHVKETLKQQYQTVKVSNWNGLL